MLQWSMVMDNAHAVLGGKAFEGALCIDGFRQCEVACHEIDKLQTQKMIGEDRCVPVAGLGKRALCLGIKTRLSRLHVVDRDALPRLGGGKKSVTIILSFFGAPRNFCHGPKETSSAAGRPDVGKLGGDIAIAGELLELAEQGMAEMVVPAHQLGLVVWSGKGVLFGLVKDGRWVEREGIAMKEVRVRSELVRGR
jgi:hypothetical protein